MQHGMQEREARAARAPVTAGFAIRRHARPLEAAFDDVLSHRRAAGAA
jgi:hypothetical protein